ncbi:MAG TPA: glycogen/starch synthase [Spirochaetota bacterium]|nr:glycogen/starch synthase [Spirochaetota bacterium]
MENSTLTSLSRFRISDENLIRDSAVKESISTAYKEGRCYEFYPDNYVIDRIRSGDPVELFRERFFEMAGAVMDSNAGGGKSFREKLAGDTRLFSRITNAIANLHRGAALCGNRLISTRRIVLIQELPGRPTFHHISSQTTVIAHVGQGPEWQEVPSIYLGLKTFDAIHEWRNRQEPKIFEAFRYLLEVEERAIETGYSHSTLYSAEISLLINYLVDSVIEYSTMTEQRYKEEAPVQAVEKLSDAKRTALVEKLNARLQGSELNFDFDLNLEAVLELENFSREYKKGYASRSLREIVKLLVAASGHDIHEIRNRANIILERIFSPKEFDAPLATRFINMRAGESYNFEFRLHDFKPASGYYLRVYSTVEDDGFNTLRSMKVEEVPLTADESGTLKGSFTFSSYGHYDFCVISRTENESAWVDDAGTSGRINVLPDLRGEIILEVFVDIHGHTRLYWRDNDEHPGLVYNEHGEVIRLGTLDDITCHLEDLAERYHVSSIYLLGVQQRGTNREDWAPEATSPSPFSPMSMTAIEPALGGDRALRELIEKAHSLNIKIIVDIIPHLNRRSSELGPECSVFTYDGGGILVERASTDGRYGSWNDGKLLNYRMFEVWEWLSDSICTLIERFDIDGIRFDSAHAVPIMMKRNNYPFVHGRRRSDEEMLCGNIIVNDREYGHFVTTGYYDCECRDRIAVPLHFYLMQNVERKIRSRGKDFFINIAECFWGHEKYLTRTGLVPYNSSLFKICENVTHGKSDVREIYHIYDNYFPSVLPEGTELLGILGNHDERRALNTFGHRGLRAAVALTSFMSSIIMDYEGSAEGEGWKVYLDNIFVNWNQFEYASHRSLEGFYRDMYRFHTGHKGRGALVWANNNMAAASLKFAGEVVWLGIFNFSDANQDVSVQFDNPVLDIGDDEAFILSDPLYSAITHTYRYYTGRELKVSRINTVVTYTDRTKILRLEKTSLAEHYDEFLADSFLRLCELDNTKNIYANFFYSELVKHCDPYEDFTDFITDRLLANKNVNRDRVEFGLKRSIFHLYRNGEVTLEKVKTCLDRMENDVGIFPSLAGNLRHHYEKGSMVFMSAEAEPFSKSGGLANVVYELPRELVRAGEDVYVITPLYRNGSQKEKRKMDEALEKYNIQYTGKNVKLWIMSNEYEVGVHYGEVEGIKYYLLDHYEFFNGLYWGVTAEEKLRKRIGFARACAEVILSFGINAKYTFTNDAFTGVFNGIIRSDHYYDSNPVFRNCTFIHIMHNGGWQYFDAYERMEKGFDLFNLFNLPSWRAGDFCDPVFGGRLSCMATGIRFARKTITVSPSYARQVEIACDGLERILHDVKGISNGIGSDFRSKIDKSMVQSGFVENHYPALLDRIKNDSELKAKIKIRYPEILKGDMAVQSIADPQRRKIVSRMRNKLMLQIERGLKADPDMILAAMIHRISEQKGFQLLLEASEGIFRELGFQVITGGSVSAGDNRGETIANGLYLLSQYYPESVHASFGFQDVSVPLLCADFFLMPSMHEPGGISQLEAMAAGCAVIARATGGLRDTIKPVTVQGDNVEGFGFLFTDFSPWAFFDAMKRASDFFRSADDIMLNKLRENSEKASYFWDKPAQEYINTVYDLTETIRM